MGLGKNKALFAVIASLMMLCVATVPMLSAEEDVSADTSGSADFNFTSIEDLLENAVSMDIKKGIVGSSVIDNDIGDGISDAMEKFISDSGLMTLIYTLMLPIGTENVFDDVKVINTVETIADGQSVYLNDKTGKFANLKFEGEGKYVIERGGSIVLGPMFKLEGNGTIIELKEGSLIKFSDFARGYEVPYDMSIALNGKYESYYSIDYGSDEVGWSDLSELFPTKIKASMYCDLDGTLGFGPITITGGSDKDFTLDVDYKTDKETGSVDGSAELTVNVGSIVLKGDAGEVQIKDIALKVSGSITNAKGISFELSVGATLIVPDQGSIVVNNTITGSATYEKDTGNGSLKANIGLNVAIKSGDLDAKITGTCAIDASKTDDQITAKVSASIDDFTVPTMEVKGVKLDLELKGTEEQMKDGDLKDILTSFYASAEKFTYGGTDAFVIGVSNVSMKLDKSSDEPKLIADIGKLDVRFYESRLQTLSVSGSDLTITVGMADDDDDRTTTIEGNSLAMKATPISSADFAVSAKDFKIINDDIMRLVSGTYKIDGDAVFSGTDIEIQKDAKVDVDTVEIRDSTVYIASYNDGIDGLFLFYPGSEYECGENSVLISERSVGIFSVKIDSESQTFLVKPLTGFDLIEQKEGLEYTVREDGYGEFNSIPLNGTLVAAGEPKSYNLTIDGNTTKQKYMGSVQLPEAPEGKEGYTFYKWTDGYKTYKAGSSLIMPARDVTITALWTETAQKTEVDKTITIFGDSDLINISGNDIKDAISKLEAKTIDNLEIKTGTSKISFDGTTAKTLDKFTESGFSATVKQADKSVFDEEMSYVVGNGALYSIDFTNGTETVHDLGGTVMVTVIYDLDGEDISDLNVFYYSEYGTTEAVDFTATEIGDGKAEVTMELTHFSDYVVKAQPAESTDGGDDNGMTVGVIAGIIAAAIIAVAVIAFVAIKRKG